MGNTTKLILSSIITGLIVLLIIVLFVQKLRQLDEPNLSSEDIKILTPKLRKLKREIDFRKIQLEIRRNHIESLKKSEKKKN